MAPKGKNHNHRDLIHQRGSMKAPLDRKANRGCGGRDGGRMACTFNLSRVPRVLGGRRSHPHTHPWRNPEKLGGCSECGVLTPVPGAAVTALLALLVQQAHSTEGCTSDTCPSRPTHKRCQLPLPVSCWWARRARRARGNSPLACSGPGQAVVAQIRLAKRGFASCGLGFIVQLNLCALVSPFVR